jgi:hypothetical protein
MLCFLRCLKTSSEDQGIADVIFASTAGWIVGLTGVLGITVVGTVVGALTGFMLDWLLRNPRDKISDI